MTESTSHRTGWVNAPPSSSLSTEGTARNTNQIFMHTFLCFPRWAVYFTSLSSIDSNLCLALKSFTAPKLSSKENLHSGKKRRG